MKKLHPRRIHWPIWALVVSLALLLLMVNLPQAEAGTSPAATRPAITLTPPAPTLTPTLEPTSAITPSPPPAAQGSYIELSVRSAAVQFWTAVEWRDDAGDWHAVEGWTGALDVSSVGDGRVRWWVEAGDFGAGPFRWVVYDRADGARLAVSDSFYLPSSTRETVSVELSILEVGGQLLPESGTSLVGLGRMIVGIALVTLGTAVVLLARSVAYQKK